MNSSKTYFEDARHTCLSLGGKLHSEIKFDLVSIGSKEENDFVYQLLRNNNWSMPWIAMRGHLSNKSSYYWVDGSNSHYRNWNKKEPNSKPVRFVLLCIINGLNCFTFLSTCSVLSLYIKFINIERGLCSYVWPWTHCTRYLEQSNLQWNNKFCLCKCCNR